MVAQPGPEMLFPALTWAYATAAESFPARTEARASHGCPADTGHIRLLAVSVPKYVPKF